VQQLYFCSFSIPTRRNRAEVSDAVPLLSCTLGTAQGQRIQGESLLCCKLTESQNGGGWKGPLWVTQSNALPKHSHPEQAAQDLVQAGLEYLQRRRLHSLPGQQPVPGLRYPQREEALPQSPEHHLEILTAL